MQRSLMCLIRSQLLSVALTLGVMLVAGSYRTPLAVADDPAVMWINHLDLLPGDSSVTTSHNAVSSGVGGGLAGLVIQSSTTGDTATPAGNKVVWRALETPPGFQITGVRVCYELSNRRSFITQIRLSQVQDPPSSAMVQLDDGTNQTDTGPTCVDSRATSIDPSVGAVLLSLRVNFGDTSDRIVIRGLALLLADVAGVRRVQLEP